MWKDKISGGLADKLKPSNFNVKALNKGIKVELEHTNKKDIAQEIAMDHLKEDGRYYYKLEKMEMKKASLNLNEFIERKIKEANTPPFFETFKRSPVKVLKDVGNVISSNTVDVVKNILGKESPLEKKIKALPTYNPPTKESLFGKDFDIESEFHSRLKRKPLDYIDEIRYNPKVTHDTPYPLYKRNEHNHANKNYLNNAIDEYHNNYVNKHELYRYGLKGDDIKKIQSGFNIF